MRANHWETGRRVLALLHDSGPMTRKAIQAHIGRSVDQTMVTLEKGGYVSSFDDVSDTFGERHAWSIVKFFQFVRYPT